MAVEVKIKMSPKQAGKLYMQHMALKDQMQRLKDELTSILSEAETSSTMRFDWLDEKGRYHDFGKMFEVKK